MSGGCQGWSFTEIAGQVCRGVDYDRTLHYDTMKPDGTPRTIVEYFTAYLLGWHARTGPEEGIRKNLGMGDGISASGRRANPTFTIVAAMAPQLHFTASE